VAASGGQPGNKNPAKAKPWKEALRKSLIQFEATGIKPGEALAKIAERVVTDALAGDKDAWTEIANRLDGKPETPVSVEHSGLVAHEHHAISETAQFLTDALGARADRAPEKPVSH
jgi:hypothetical protein